MTAANLEPTTSTIAVDSSRRRMLSAAAASASAVVIGPLAAFMSIAARAADFPNHTITLIVPFAAGGIADITARAVSGAMATILKQAIVVENRPGAGNIVGTGAAAKAPADGYTLLLVSNGNAVATGLFKKLPYDIVRDFAPVGTFGFFDLGIFLDSKSKLNTVADIVQYAKAHPGKLNIGSIAIGSTQNLSAELFRSVTGIDAAIIPYNGTPAVLTALRGGDIDIAFEIMGPLMGQITSKTLRVAAVTSDKRFALLPSVPTVQEAGFPTYFAASWNGLAVPAKTPPEVIAKLNAAANEALKSPEVTRQLQSIGVRPQGGTPDDLKKLLALEIKRWGDVIKAAKIEPQ